mmetsp:Transcript_7231/g.19696  ORF Transcript_7231/g.19696 Transcript_7231/m.19696 type:complete len:448 (+) Transcript_7231:15-1358(+)
MSRLLIASAVSVASIAAAASHLPRRDTDAYGAGIALVRGGSRVACGVPVLMRFRAGDDGGGAGDNSDGDDDDDDDDYEEVDEMEEAEMVAVDRATALKAAGNALIKAGDCEGAAIKYHEAIGALAFDGTGSREAAELDRRCRLNLASCYMRTGDLEDAMDQCNAILSNFPACSKALSKRAQAREASGDFVDALADFQAAVKLAPPAEVDQLEQRVDKLERIINGAPPLGDSSGGGGMGDLLSQFGSGPGGPGPDLMDSMSKLSDMFGGGGGAGGLGALAGLADTGLLPPGVKRMLGLVQVLLKVQASVKRVISAVEPLRPYLVPILLLLPMIHWVLSSLASAMRGGRPAEAPAASPPPPPPPTTAPLPIKATPAKASARPALAKARAPKGAVASMSPPVAIALWDSFHRVDGYAQAQLTGPHLGVAGMSALLTVRHGSSDSTTKAKA